MWENWDKLLNEIAIIKWGVICLTFMCLCKFICSLYNGIPNWWNSFNKKKKKPFTLEQMKKDLAASERPAIKYPRKDDWMDK